MTKPTDDDLLSDLASRLEPHLSGWRWDDDDDPDAHRKRARSATTLDAEVAIATELLELFNRSTELSTSDIECESGAYVWDWMAELPGRLADAGRFADGLALADCLRRWDDLEAVEGAIPRLIAGMGRPEQAIRLMSAHVTRDPEYPPTLLHAARMWFQIGDLTKAEKYCRRGLKFARHDFASRDAIVECLIGVLRQSNRHDEIVAIEQVEREIKAKHEAWIESLFAPGVTVVRTQPKIGRNDPCPCGSGKKLKKCCSAVSRSP